MMSWYRFLLTCLPLLALLHVNALAAGPLIEEISFNAVSPQEETITFKLNGPHIPKIFSIKNGQPRVVFDFPDVGYKGGLPRTIAGKGGLVQAIRVGLHPAPAAKTRVVLDLVTSTSLDVKHQFNETTNTLVITIIQLDASAAKPSTKVPVQKDVKKTPPESPAEQPPVPKAVTGSALPVAPEPPPSLPQQEQAGPPAQQDAADIIQPAPLVVGPPPGAAGETAAKTTAAAKGKVSSAAPETTRTVTPPAPGGTSARPTPPTLSDAPAGAAGSTTPPLLKNISFDANSSRGEMILFSLNDFYPPIVFGLEQGLPKVVCDFMNTKAAPEVSTHLETKGKHVEHIRVAQHQNPDKLRVVIDLVPNKNYDLQQVFFKEDNMFVIIVNLLNDSTGKTDVVPARQAPQGKK
ncbi:MAG: hypothetical protein BWK76_06270 [Desulfobulbaceae bacterium A2]|nr:MAG: hypothetical protein BWK76_06270 [Desulfobulbaceae bacterium A2]